MTGLKQDALAAVFLALLGAVLGLLSQPSSLRPRQVLVQPNSAVTEAATAAEWLQAITADDVLKGLKTGALQVIDARPASAYVAAHLPGSLPLWAAEKQLLFPQLLTLLDPESVVVVTDDQGDGFGAMRLAFWLRQRGFLTIKFLSGGLKDWQEQSLPVVAGWDFNWQELQERQQ